ncbi:MAG: SGNH/GDSL hydrolase family protein [Prevotella sp.]|nr:SGNH/GDSL hydrolase family protein [Prevotella sp.]
MMKQIIFLLLSLMSILTIQAQTDPLQGKRIGVIGDSYVRNHREPIENTWHYKFAKKHGMKYYNYGRNGNCVSVNLKTWGPAMVNRYEEMNDSLDIVVVIAGHNDAARLDSTITPQLYREKCTELCQELIEKFPRAYIFWFTPWANKGAGFERVVAITKEVCGSMGIPVFDSYHDSNIFSLSDRFRDIYFQGGHRDTAHLNNLGHDRFLPVAENFILKYCVGANGASGE